MTRTVRRRAFQRCVSWHTASWQRDFLPRALRRGKAIVGLLVIVAGCSTAVSSQSQAATRQIFGRSIAAADSHTLAITNDGTVIGWGQNDVGWLGRMPLGDGVVAAVVPGITNAIGIATSRTHSLVLASDWTVRAFGANESGELGLPSSSPSPAPTKIVGLPEIVNVAAGPGYSLFLTPYGQVYFVGRNLIDGTATSTPSLVPGTSSFVIASIAAGENHAVASLRSVGAIAWGSNANGQLGRVNGTSQPSMIPNVSEITAGGNFTVARTTSGELVTFGDNRLGQLGRVANGDGPLGPSSFNPTPGPVAGAVGAFRLSAGTAHTLLLMSDFSVGGFGSNASGQLGAGPTTTGVRMLSGFGSTAEMWPQEERIVRPCVGTDLSRRWVRIPRINLVDRIYKLRQRRHAYWE